MCFLDKDAIESVVSAVRREGGKEGWTERGSEGWTGRVEGGRDGGREGGTSLVSALKDGPQCRGGQ